MRSGRDWGAEASGEAGDTGGMVMRRVEPPLCHDAGVAQLLLFKQFIAGMNSAHP